jgi:diguanylate cyclase (GGDEF)-like protein
MRPFRTLAARILFLFLALFILVQAIAFVAIDRARMEQARALVEGELWAGGVGLDRQLQARCDRFFLAARVLSGDLGFKKAFGSGHRPTLVAAMRNHCQRLDADVMTIVSLDGTVVADLQRPEAPSSRFGFPHLIEAAERYGSASGLVTIGEHLSQVVVFPILAPAPAAWLCIGYRMDDEMAGELKRLLALDVTFVRETADEPARITATTLDAADREALLPALGAAAGRGDGAVTFTLNGQRFQGFAHPLQTQGAERSTVYLQRSLDEALAPFYRLRRIQLAIFAAGLVAMVGGGVFVSTTVTSQLRRLADGARSVEAGDYTRPLPVCGADELARVSKAFNLMQEAIAQREAQIRHQAYFDALTGLPNRSGLYARLEEALAAARARDASLALIVMNIERFVTVIAALGHAAGSSVLQKVGALLVGAAPPSAVVARLHADVFAVLLRGGEGVDDAVRLVREIQRRLEEPLPIDEIPVQIEGRFGIVASPVHGEDTDSLLRHVDVAVHLAKGSHDGYTVYTPELDSHSRRHLALLGDLRRAMENNELVMYYQPKVRFGSGRVAGLEALIRWRHPQHGFIPPGEFISLAEGTGLIAPVTAWTLDAAIGECASMNRQGVELGMAVNLSARLLQDHRLPDSIAALVKRHQVPPCQITLEITESAIMADPERTLEVVAGLDATGVRLSVDDFGTGYSSLSYLRRLPVDELKIDKSFVQRMDADENDAAIVRSIIELGHTLSLKVTAEGVESQRIFEMLKASGCDLAQGYLHGKPMPVAELLAWTATSPWGLGARG